MTDRSFPDFVAGESTGLLRTAYLLTNDHRAARDLLQTALIATHRQWDQLTDPAGYARRELVRTHTGWRRLLRVGDLLAESPLMAGATGLPGFATGAPAEPGPRTELTSALAALPPRLRAALVLRHGTGLTEDAAAEALDAPVDQLRDAVTVGLARLRELLPGDDALDVRLRTELAVRVAEVTAVPEQATALALDGARDQRNHLLGLAALAGFVVLVVLVVALTT